MNRDKPTLHIVSTMEGSIGEITKDLIPYFKESFDITIEGEEESKDYKTLLCHFVNPIVVRHENFEKFERKILIQPIDGTSIKEDVVECINKFDLVITPGSAGKRIMLENGVTSPIIVIRNFYKDDLLIRSNKIKINGIPDDKIIFYHESTGHPRKGTEILYEAFIKAFSDTEYTDKVCLLVKDSAFNERTFERLENVKGDTITLQKQYKNPVKIIKISQNLKEETLKKIWNKIDLYASMAKIEGFGIPLLRMAVLQKPIIALNSPLSGYIDWLNKDNSYLISTKTELSKDNFIFVYKDDNTKWSVPINIDFVIKALRDSLRDYIRGEAKVVDFTTIKRMNINVIAKEYIKAIKSSIKKQSYLLTSSVRINGQGLKYVAPLGNSGYAEAAKNYMLSLNKFTPVTWKPQNFDNGTPNENLTEFINKEIKWNNLILHTTPEYWQRLLTEEGIKSLKDKRGIKVIGQTVWETDRIHDSWVPYCNNPLLDEIWVPVQWNKEVFIKCGVTTSIKVVPHIFVKEDLVNAFVSDIDDDDYVFYTIGQWTNRKGIQETIEAFCKSFIGKDKVCLVVKTFADNFSESEVRKCQNRIEKILNKFRNPPKVIFIGENCSREQILALHNRGDCYLSLCKGEGWGLGAFEAAAYGKPVIITNYGGQTEFFPKGYSLLIDYKLIRVQQEFTWYTKDQKWAQPSIEDAIIKIKEVYNNQNKYKEIGFNLSIHINKNFGQDSIIKILKQNIKTK